MVGKDQTKGTAINSNPQALKALDRGEAPADSSPGGEGLGWRQCTVGVGREQLLAIP